MNGVLGTDMAGDPILFGGGHVDVAVGGGLAYACIGHAYALKGLFRKLRKLAVRYGGVIVFFDEADSLGNRGVMSQGGIFGPGGVAGATGPFAPHSPFGLDGCHGGAYLSEASLSVMLQSGGPRSSAGPSEPPATERRKAVPFVGMGGGGMGTLHALLTELSGLKKPRGFMNRVVRRVLGLPPKAPPKYRIMVMMATNMPQALDEALLRPGRIDRIYKVGYPSKEGRVRTYMGYLNKVAHDLTPEQVDKLATITPYATGATIKDLVNEALILSIRAGRNRITWADVVRAKQLKELGPPEDVEYVERERHAVAVHEACHAVCALKVRRHLEVDLATIEKGGTYLGMVASIKPEDRFTRWRSEYEADVMVALASLAGERIFFSGDSSSGVSGDLESATTIASMMEGYWGMGSTIASHGVTQQLGTGGAERPKGDGGPRELLAGTLGQRIEAKLAELLERTDQLLRDNRLAVLALAHALETHKTLSGEDVQAVVEGTQGPLVDGRVYSHPRFAEVIEAYHAAQAQAHREQRRADTPLPKAHEWAPELQPAPAMALAASGEAAGWAPDSSEWGLPAPVPADAAANGHDPVGLDPAPDSEDSQEGPSPNGSAH